MIAILLLNTVFLCIMFGVVGRNLPRGPGPRAAMQIHDLYFFLFPPRDAGEAAALQWLRILNRLKLASSKGPMPAHRLHVTLHHLGRFEGAVPCDVVDIAWAAAGRLVHEPFDVCFNQIQSRGGPRAGHRGTVEMAGWGGGVQMLRTFQRALGGAMRQAGFAEMQIRSHFVPHLTLHYGVGGIQRMAVAPLAWTVREFALVDSLYGLSRHDVLARWPLVAHQQSFSGW